MSEETLLVTSNNNSNNTKLSLFQAQTSQFQINPSLAKRCHESSPDATPVILRGSKRAKTIVGRGHDATVKIGKTNKRVSREHVVIEHKPKFNGFELTILSPNGALVDHIVFGEGEHVPLVEGTIIEIVGTRLIFKIPQEEEQEEEQEKEQEKEKEETMIPIKIEEESQTESLAIVNPLDDNSKSPISKPKKVEKKEPLSLEEEVIQILVYSRKSSMTCTDITKKLNERETDKIFKMLTSSLAIGCIKRQGKTADGSPKEDLYYYKADSDPNKERQAKYSNVGRSVRKCAMKDTQYFFKIPPKLPNHHHHNNSNNNSRTRNHASNNKIKKKVTRSNREEEKVEDEELKSDNSSDMEIYELFKDVE
ncbi:MAG: hypothetical protein EXX96DRAFT_653331 [Benjaminiella poitrasii]|nr:MAG: hypothetical protein EXX96DRAFT_653331 [Benjaminiella poitrasii]